MDLRERAMARLAAGESLRRVASSLDVAPSSVVKWSQRLRETGSCAPAGTGGHPPRKIVGAHETWLLERIRDGMYVHNLADFIDEADPTRANRQAVRNSVTKKVGRRARLQPAVA
jgi:putative transposase